MGELVKITEYDEFREKINAVKDVCNFIPDVSTDEGYQKSKRVALDVTKVLTKLEDKRKELKAESLEYGRRVDAEAKKIKEELQEFMLPHKEAYKELDNLKKRMEEERKAGLEKRIAEMRDLPELMRDASSDSIKLALEDVTENECLDFYEYTMQALKVRNASKEKLSKMFEDALKYETEQAELERLRAEKEERDRKEREEKIAREAAEKARIEAENKAKAEAEAAEHKAQEEREAAAKREAEAKAAQERAEKARVAAEEKAKQDAIDAEKRQKEAIKAAEERAIQQAEEAKQREFDEAKKREANKRHHAKINNEAVADLKAGGLSEKDAKTAVTLIAQQKVRNVFIRY